MEDKEMVFVDTLRKEWFSGNTSITPTQIIKNIPSQMKQLINIIDKLNNENIELKEKTHG